MEKVFTQDEAQQMANALLEGATQTLRMQKAGNILADAARKVFDQIHPLASGSVELQAALLIWNTNFRS